MLSAHGFMRRAPGSAGPVERDSASIGKIFFPTEILTYWVGSCELICYHLMHPSGRPEKRECGQWKPWRPDHYLSKTNKWKKEGIVDLELGVLLRESRER